MPPPSIPAQDYADVQNLYAYYNHCSDAGDAEGYASCFVAGGELRIPSIGLRVTGQAALRDFKLSDKARRGERVRRHWNSGLELSPLEAGRLRGRCYLHGYNALPGEAPELADVGRYEDVLVREAQGWRFVLREIHMDHSQFTAPA